ncbi:hypothetical protein QCA50_013861 [Cerrena zonata]|uniref:R3H domain-containing protein n=1 Tax=Cerrena zonata TaxID=2478898 RepID=A0AAW0FQ64_9APHY
MVEKSFSDFVSSAKKSQILPHMPESRRKFVHDLATVYRMDTQMVDQEPYRSVQLIRRIDSRVPSPLLSTTASSASTSTTSSGLGRLTDLRAPAPSQSIKPTTSGASAWTRSTPSGSTPGSSAQTKTRGWTSVVNQRSTPKPDANPTACQPLRQPLALAPLLLLFSLLRAKSQKTFPDDWEDDT